MSNALLSSPFQANKEKLLTLRLQNELNTTRIFKALDADPNTIGAGVVFIDHEFTVVTLRSFEPICRKLPIRLILREPPRHVSTVNYASELKASRRESKLTGELLNTGLSCGAAVLSWIVVLGATTAIPITGGASTAVTYLGVAAATASSLQCLNGAVRSIAEARYPEDLDWLEEQEWYNAANTALDIISLGGAAAAGATTIKMVQTLRKTTSKSLTEILKGLSRADRKRLTLEIQRLNQPGISQSVLKTLTNSGKLTTRYSSQALVNAISLNIKDAVGASLSISGSAYGGTIKNLAVGIYEELSVDVR
ncbi:hypothetical protein G3495_17365 [Shewanella baltica]|uniref:hypothetical protein n=1 Tax=Shewanella baltica TaxID=62322 RepID=UPI00217DB404|nr:hypothetical protein [Shewanella baltica]MCS6236859.1 hypothetical protein [Shewanella baltica]MCS6260810.1 hypothetical protein [Shewanella baltica]MCS6271354.1 hypothetical protein [Shewanella baltica]